MTRSDGQGKRLPAQLSTLCTRVKAAVTQRIVTPGRREEALRRALIQCQVTSLIPSSSSLISSTVDEKSCVTFKVALGAPPPEE